MKNFWISFAAAQMGAAGDALALQDANSTGTDDILAKILKVGGTALGAYIRGDAKGVNGALKTIRDSIDSYLASV